MAAKQYYFVLILMMLLRSGGVSGQLIIGNSSDDGDNGMMSSSSSEMVPAMFIFGDSLIDNGNNNNLPLSFAKANYLPYAEMLGLPLIPPFSSTNGDQALHGVNYASAAAGILDVTGRNFVGRIPFNQQIRNFEITLDQITNNLGAVDVAQSLASCIFFVGMGSNDYLNNYLMPNYPTRNQYNAQQFADLLVQQYSQQLTRLYNLGARKVVIVGLGLMGCIPSILAQSPSGSCSTEVNQLVMPFNANVKIMINNLNTNLPGSKFIYVDTAHMFQDLLANSTSYGFSVINRGCCGIGRNRGQITCLPLQTPCPNRQEYIFWDAFHPTSAVNIIMGKKAFNGDNRNIYPINIQQLANLKIPTTTN
ncbi:hypothetical protein CsatA_030685 [Cannabis sativa]